MGFRFFQARYTDGTKLTGLYLEWNVRNVRSAASGNTARGIQDLPIFTLDSPSPADTLSASRSVWVCVEGLANIYIGANAAWITMLETQLETTLSRAIPSLTVGDPHETIALELPFQWLGQVKKPTVAADTGSPRESSTLSHYPM